MTSALSYLSATRVRAPSCLFYFRINTVPNFNLISQVYSQIRMTIYIIAWKEISSQAMLHACVFHWNHIHIMLFFYCPRRFFKGNFEL